MFQIFNQFDIWAFLDVTFLSFIIYNVFMLIRGTRAAQMLTGLLIILAAFLISNILPLTTMQWVLSKFYSSFLIFLIIIFQEDIRHVLRRMGRRSFMMSNDQALSKGVFDQIGKAAVAMAKKKIGALIVLERSIILNRYIDVGAAIDGQVSSELLYSIFNTASPIHDGAVIIQGGRIAAAGCFLPLATDIDLDSNLGTRHRAGIGVSNETDAVVVIVSEEKGTVSIAAEGQLETISSEALLKKRLRQLMQAPMQKTTKAQQIKKSIEEAVTGEAKDADS